MRSAVITTFFLLFLLVFGGVFVGIILVIRSNARAGKKHFEDASAALLPLIAGKAEGQKMNGTYSGMAVTASMVADMRTDVSDSTRDRVYYFSTQMAAGKGHGDWTLAYAGDGFLKTGAKSWHIETKDEALKTRLTEAGTLKAIERWQDPKSAISYSAADGWLHAQSRELFKPVWPDAAAFANHLEVLAALAECNRKANTAAPA